MNSILIVEDDITFSLMIKTVLTKKGFKVNTVSNILNAKKAIKEQSYDLILSDMRLPDQEGEDLLKWMHTENLHIPFIIMTSYADVQSAVRVIKLGAFDYITKPFHPEDLLNKMNEALNTPPIVPLTRSEVKEAPQQSHPSDTYIQGNSLAAQQLYQHVDLVAPTNLSVLIEGASGTGKEHIAHLIHKNSTRSGKPFIAIDCGAIPKDLAASEFFGHIKGAFTGAFSDKTGALVEAQGGTIFLDEIGNLNYNTQIQLLRALQERIITPIGSNTEVNIDIRLIAATNEDLPKAIELGEFREDLYHRINEFSIRVPDIRERTEDLPLFMDFFLTQSNKEFNKSVVGFTPEAKLGILQYPWPGNIRQLRNSIRKATLLTQTDWIEFENLELDLSKPTSRAEDQSLASQPLPTLSIELYDEESEKEKIIAALKHTKNNKTQAAKLLKIDRKTLYNKIKLYELDL